MAAGKSTTNRTIKVMLSILIPVIVALLTMGIGQTLSVVNKNADTIKHVDDRVDSLAGKQLKDIQDMTVRMDTFMVRINTISLYNQKKLDDIDLTLKEIKHELRRP